MSEYLPGGWRLYVRAAVLVLATMAGVAVVGHALPATAPWMQRLIPIFLLVAGVLVVLYPFAYLLTGLAGRRQKTFITFENDNGTVSVSTDAVQEYLNGLKGEFAAVIALKSHLRVVRGALDVGLVLGVRDGTQIPELCKLMQARVRELLEEHLGTCDFAGVSIEVAEIRSRKKPAAEEPA